MTLYRAGKRENLVPIKPANFGMPYNENVSCYITSIAR